MTSELIRSAKPSAASAKLITQATNERNRLLALAVELEPDRQGRQSQLHLIADGAVRAFWAAPSRQLAEIAHDALVRNRDAEVSFTVLNEGIHLNLPRVAKLAEPAALEIIDQAIAELNRQHEAAVAASPEGGVFSTRAQLDAQHATALSDLRGERNNLVAGADPLHWLECHGFGIA
jgi:hypothetical protein